MDTPSRRPSEGSPRVGHVVEGVHERVFEQREGGSPRRVVTVELRLASSAGRAGLFPTARAKDYFDMYRTLGPTAIMLTVRSERARSARQLRQPSLRSGWHDDPGHERLCEGSTRRCLSLSASASPSRGCTTWSLRVSRGTATAVVGEACLERGGPRIAGTAVVCRSRRLTTGAPAAWHWSTFSLHNGFPDALTHDRHRSALRILIVPLAVVGDRIQLDWVT